MPKIDSYHFGRIIIDGQVHTQDVIILPNGVLGNWWRREGHSLHIDDLAAVFAAKPAVLIVGQGSISRMDIPEVTRQALQAAGIELIALPTGAACQTYNAMQRKDKTIAAALHLTC